MANTKPIGVAYEDQNIIGADIVKATNICDITYCYHAGVICHIISFLPSWQNL